MNRHLAMPLCLLLASAVHAAPADLACHWDKPAGKPPVGGSAAVARLYAAPSDPLFLRLDADANTVAHNDPDHAQAGTLPTLRLSGSGTGVIITASSVNLKEVQGLQTLLEISVDRYTLESEMLFLMQESLGSAPVSQWTRSGRCVLRKF